MQDDASVTLVSPDKQSEVQENATVGDATSVQHAFDVVNDLKTASCLTALFTAELQKPGQLPEGVSVSGLQFTQQPVQAGDQVSGTPAASP